MNCIIANNGSSSGNYPNVYFASNAVENSSNFYYSCVVPGAVNVLAANQGNITNNPMLNANNYPRLAPGSPCMNTGTNQSWMTGARDLGGQKRIWYGTVDMGAYEAFFRGTIYGFR